MVVTIVMHTALDTVSLHDNVRPVVEEVLVVEKLDYDNVRP